jgi:hypothetical protein
LELAAQKASDALQWAAAASEKRKTTAAGQSHIDDDGQPSQVYSCFGSALPLFSKRMEDSDSECFRGEECQNSFLDLDELCREESSDMDEGGMDESREILQGLSPLRSRERRSGHAHAGRQPATASAPKRNAPPRLREGWQVSLCESTVICYPKSLPPKEAFAIRKVARPVSPEGSRSNSRRASEADTAFATIEGAMADGRVDAPAVMYADPSSGRSSVGSMSKATSALQRRGAKAEDARGRARGGTSSSEHHHTQQG